MLMLLIHWILTAWICFIAGMGILRLWARLNRETTPERAAPGLDMILLAGLLTCTALTAWLSTFTGIGGPVKSAFAGTALLLSALWRREAGELLRQALSDWRAASRAVKGVAVALLLFCLLGSSMPSPYFDTPLYHSQAIQWTQMFPVTPGLGNLYTRFAFNSHFFLPSALCSSAFSDTNAVYPLNGFLFLLTMLRLLFDTGKAVSAKDGAALVFKSVLAVLFLFDSTQYINTAAPHMIVSVVAVFAILTFMEDAPPYGDGTRRLMMWLILFSAVTFKLSAAYLLVLFPFLIMRNAMRKQLAQAAVIGLLIIAPFLYRNYVLSGYLVYPILETGLFEPDWKMPVAAVRAEEQHIRKYAHLAFPPEGVPAVEDDIVPEFTSRPFGAWLPQWFSGLEHRWKAILICNVLLLIPLPASIARRAWHEAAWQFAILANALAWFLTTPDPKYAAGILFTGCAATAAFFLKGLFPLWKTGFSAVAVSVFALLILLMGYVGYKSVRHEGLPVNNLLYPAPLAVAGVERRPLGSFEVGVPMDGKCYNAPLPCTLVIKKGLMPRGTRPQDGFRRYIPFKGGDPVE